MESPLNFNGVSKMNEESSKNTAFHRSVSNHVLNFVPVKSEGVATLKWPLGFLTEDCKKSSEFEDREVEVANHILAWANDLDGLYNELKNIVDVKKKKSCHPYVVRANWTR